MDHPDQLQLRFSSDVSVVRLPEGEIRLRPRAPMITGSVRDAARVLDVSTETVRQLIHEGAIRAWKPRKRWFRVNMATVYAYKERQQAEHTLSA